MLPLYLATSSRACRHLQSLLPPPDLATVSRPCCHLRSLIAPRHEATSTRVKQTCFKNFQSSKNLRVPATDCSEYACDRPDAGIVLPPHRPTFATLPVVSPTQRWHRTATSPTDRPTFATSPAVSPTRRWHRTATRPTDHTYLQGTEQTQTLSRFYSGPFARAEQSRSSWFWVYRCLTGRSGLGSHLGSLHALQVGQV